MTRVSVEAVSPIERRIKVEVPPETVAQTLDRAYRSLAHSVRVPGFRPGKVPRRLLESRYRDKVETEVVQELVQKSILEAVESHNLIPVGPPRVSNEGLKEGEPFRFQAHVEVSPQVDPQGYDGLALVRRPIAVDEAAVDAELARLRDSLAEFVQVEGRAAQLGDHAVVSYIGSVEGATPTGKTRSDVPVEIAPGEFMDGKVPALEGARVGETREVAFDFPSTLRAPEFAGKAATVKVTVTALKQKKLPALDDELARDLGGGDTLDDLKAKVRVELLARRRDEQDREIREQIVSKLIEKNPFDVPAAMVERAIEAIIGATATRMSRQGMEISKDDLDTERLRETVRGPALAQVKGALLLAAIADREKLSVTPEELRLEIKQIASRSRSPEDKVRAYFRGEARADLERRIRDEKTLAFLESRAKISES